jgi:pyruvate dehydrogenase E1 component alpha subunit
MALATTLDKTQIADLYRQMQVIRIFEEFSQVKYQEQKVKGFLHLYIGQEAVAVGAISALRHDDDVITSYRDHGHALAKGLDPNAVMAELYGKATGVSGGKGGSMHLFDVSKHFWGGHAIVAGQMPLGVGLALATKLRDEDRVVMCFFGDGSVNEGEFHESLNLASLWKLPVVFFLENNLYGMGTHVERSRAGGKEIYDDIAAYNIPGANVDGQDVLAVREASVEAVDRVRSGNGPVFVEAMTYRFRGHSVADAQAYRSREEIGQWRENNDPMDNLRKLTVAEGLMEESDFEEIDKEARAVVDEAVEFAENSPEPPAEALFDHVYAE